MKRKTAMIVIAVILMLSLLPLSASACGGYVAIKNEKTFHSIYCDEIIGAEYNSLIWFSTKSDAESLGYTLCNACSWDHDYDFEDGFCNCIFKTEDPFLNAVMELSFETGFDLGREAGKEDALADLDNEYEAGYDNGYEAGREIGRREAEEAYKSHQEEMRENRQGAFALVIGLVAIGYVINWLDKSKKK